MRLRLVARKCVTAAPNMMAQRDDASAVMDIRADVMVPTRIQVAASARSHVTRVCHECV